MKDTEEVVVPLRKKPRISDEDSAARLASLADQIKNNIRAGDEAKDEEPKKKKQKPLKVNLKFVRVPYHWLGLIGLLLIFRVKILNLSKLQKNQNHKVTHF